MPTKERLSLNISMKMWKNCVEAWNLTSTRLLDLVLIQILITYTHSHPCTYTLQQPMILLIKFVSFVPFWALRFSTIIASEGWRNYTAWVTDKNRYIRQAFIFWKVALLLGTGGMTSTIHTKSQKRAWKGG